MFDVQGLELQRTDTIGVGHQILALRWLSQPQVDTSADSIKTPRVKKFALALPPTRKAEWWATK